MRLLEMAGTGNGKTDTGAVRCIDYSRKYTGQGSVFTVVLEKAQKTNLERGGENEC